MATQYWATLEGEELVTALKERFERFETALSASKDLERMEIAAREYFGEDAAGNGTYRTEKAGSQDQLRVLKTGHFRSVLQNKLTIAKADTPSFVPVARNTDEKSQAQTLLAKGVIDYEMHEGGAEETVDEAVEAAEVLGWSWLVSSWEDKAGPEVERLLSVAEDGTETEQVRHEGAPTLRAVLPTDMAFEFGSRNATSPWSTHRDWTNKYDVAALLLQMGRQEDADDASDLTADVDTRIRDAFQRYDTKDSDEVPVYEFRHRKTPALPQGRLVRYLSSGVILRDEPLPYEDGGVMQVRSAKRFGSPRGYAAAHDILGLQQAVDVLTSITYSNARALGGSILWQPQGGNMTTTKLTESVTLLTGGAPGSEPKVLDLHRPGKDLQELKDSYVRDMGNLQGLDDLSQGREQRQLSGAAMALLDTRTQRAVSKLAGLRVASLKWAANSFVRLYRDFAAYSRQLPLMVGKVKQPMLRAFSRDDLASIDRVMIETASPLMKQPSGRLEVAQMVKGMADAEGRPIPYESLLAIINTGSLEPLTEAPGAQMLLIRSENERLRSGQQVRALVTDHHLNHIREHLTNTASPEIRDAASQPVDPMAADAQSSTVDVTLEHVMEHIALWRTADPAILFAVNCPPPPPPPMMGMPMPGDPSATPPPEGGASDATSAGIPPEIPGEEPGMPSLPTNPATGEEFSPTGGIQQ